MFHIDSVRCNGCGICVHICLQQAIIVRNNLAAINQQLCIQCGACLEICPANAIKEVIPAYTKSLKGGDTMVYGYGRGFRRGMGRRGGAGLGFRGASSPWPYIGRGRGGLPRCWYSGATVTSPDLPASFFYSTQTTRDGEIDWLKSQAEFLKAELSQLEARMRDLEAGG